MGKIQYSIPMPSRPSLWSSIQKGITGAALLCTQYCIDRIVKPTIQDSNLASHLTRTAGLALIWDSVFEITTEGLLYVQGKLVPYISHAPDRVSISQTRNNKKQKKKSTTKENKQIVSVVQDNSDVNMGLTTELKNYVAFLRYKNIARTGINTLINLFSVFKALVALRNFPKDTAIFSLSWPKGSELPNTGPIIKYIHVPIANPISIALMSVGFAYNFYEFLLSIKKPHPRRTEGPLIGFINATASIGASASFGYSLVHQAGGPSSPLLLSPRARLVAMTVNGIPIYYMYKNLLQLFYNGWNLILHETSRPVIEVIEEPIPMPNVKDTEQRNPLTFLPGYEQQTVTNQEVAIFPDSKNPKELPLDTSEDQVRKEKVKRKSGTPNWTQQFQLSGSNELNRNTKSHQDNETVDLYEIKEREKRLAKVRDLRNFSQINKRVIMSALQELAEILKGEISGIDGSEWELTWHYQNKNFRMKFEGPHGIDGNEFRRNKLSKVINVLEAGYLWGWDKQSRDAYLREHDCHSHLERLMYIFRERPKF